MKITCVYRSQLKKDEEFRGIGIQDRFPLFDDEKKESTLKQLKTVLGMQPWTKFTIVLVAERVLDAQVTIVREDLKSREHLASKIKDCLLNKVAIKYSSGRKSGGITELTNILENYISLVKNIIETLGQCLETDLKAVELVNKGVKFTYANVEQIEDLK